MNVEALIEELHRAGIAAKEGSRGNIKLCGPREALTPEVLARVLDHKDDLLQRFSTGAATKAPSSEVPDEPGQPHLAPVASPEDPTACGHYSAVVVLTVQGRGRLCSHCWRRWVRGDLDWPGTREVRQ